jgi:hypothetical protein
MKHSIPHPLGAERARHVAEQAFTSYAERFAEYRPTLRWRDAQHAETSFTVKGVTLTGSIEVGAREIVLDLDVPLLLRPFKSKAIEVIEREIRTWIGRAEAEKAP